jgi:hypothetical protein
MTPNPLDTVIVTAMQEHRAHIESAMAQLAAGADRPAIMAILDAAWRGLDSRLAIVRAGLYRANRT